MLDPATIAASTIAKLAYEGFVKTGAGEVAKKMVDGSVELIKGLGQRIKQQFQGNKKATAAIENLEKSGSTEALMKVEKYLDLEMVEDGTFANEVRQMAHQIINIQNQNTVNQPQQNINQGRDQFVINNPTGDLTLGGA